MKLRPSHNNLLPSKVFFLEGRKSAFMVWIVFLVGRKCMRKVLKGINTAVHAASSIIFQYSLVFRFRLTFVPISFNRKSLDRQRIETHRDSKRYKNSGIYRSFKRIFFKPGRIKEEIQGRGRLYLRCGKS